MRKTLSTFNREIAATVATRDGHMAVVAALMPVLDQHEHGSIGHEVVADHVHNARQAADEMGRHINGLMSEAFAAGFTHADLADALAGAR